jgi:YbbR domain-containing protein
MIIFVRNLVVKDFWLKLFAFALAILIWVTVQFSISGEGSLISAILGRASDERIMIVPVHVPLEGAHTFNIDPAEVKVTVRGDPKLLKGLMSEDVRAQVDLAGIESANGVRQVQIILPRGVAYTRISPDEVEVHVSPKN